jgi:hypothetical protein
MGAAKGMGQSGTHLSTIVTAVLPAFMATDVLVLIDCWEREMCDSSLLLTLPANVCESFACASLGETTRATRTRSVL